MEPTDLSIQALQEIARTRETLARVLSLIQVEQGIKHLECLWEAYCDLNEHYEITFESEELLLRDIEKEFHQHFIGTHDLEQVGF
ncbi:hypothetical protein SCBWM1_gp139 [Synechococcus phage S-CBWM1]|uniref:Uncharacterized protein n=1 Tax=Synechococcus phage S-CBWM1 TaxID=2053653 RepID=A0A3G1L3R6_9CAUD|nr:hypothetical protein HOU61_gp058 [Synechococcus phage S-CBWM1]ATW62823.1 hypothetical protein SCBWM1_gp139 [Synechococcus phage S-CBWM1]